MGKALLAKLRQKKEVYRMWKKGQATQEEYRNIVRVWQVYVKELKGPLEIKYGKGYQGQQEGLLQGYQQQKEDLGKCGPTAK